MMWRLNDIPVYSTVPTIVDAKIFNLIRLAVLKSREPIRITLNTMSHVDMIIDHDSWVCVDNTNNDFPLVAWVEFETQQRDNLHTPINCKRKAYHFVAGKVAADALATTADYLIEHFTPSPVCELVIHDKKKKVWKTTTAAELSCV